jgi:NAD(P)-dependent dehydrogenase (short-subunit alcohol dehydrogenase family)
MPLPSRPRAVVTGAGSGLGRALCIELGRRGARVLASDIDIDGARETVTQLGGAEAHALACDVAKLGDVEALADECERRFGGVDLIINNAGVAVGGRVGEVDLADWRWIVDVNLWGVVHGCHVFVPRLRRQRSGHILNVASAAGLFSPPRLGPYNMTKAAVIALSETLRAELAGDGIGVSVLCPTFFPTNIATAARGSDPRIRGTIERLMAQGKLDATDIARLALDAVEQNVLYVQPHRDARWLWRLKRASPEQFQTLVAKVLRRGR